VRSIDSEWKDGRQAFEMGHDASRAWRGAQPPSQRGIAWVGSELIVWVGGLRDLKRELIRRYWKEGKRPAEIAKPEAPAR